MKISKLDSSVAGQYEDGCGIYRIRNCSSGKSYIGETHQFRIRTYQHCTDLRCGRHKNEELQSDYNNGDEFEFSLIYPIKMYSSEWEKKRVLETFFILISDSVENGYNKSYNRFTKKLALESVLKNRDTIKAVLANEKYICRQMLFKDVVEIKL
ncbi:MAG: GIY-YIG nuclease family protein [Lachnospiraceae bacterium]